MPPPHAPHVPTPCPTAEGDRALSAEEEEARRIAEMGKPILGENCRLEVVIEESYDFKAGGQRGDSGGQWGAGGVWGCGDIMRALWGHGDMRTWDSRGQRGCGDMGTLWGHRGDMRYGIRDTGTMGTWRQWGQWGQWGRWSCRTRWTN